MSFLKDMVSNIKQIVMSDEDDNLFDEDTFEQEKQVLPKLPFAKKSKSDDISENNNNSGLSFDLNSYNMNAPRVSNRKYANKGHIQVYAPKSYEQSFDIIRDVKDGVTAMVNVEVCNPQISQRIIDIITGALIALGGQCKKMGEKQYIFSLNAEMSGAIDYIPGQSNLGMQSQYSPFPSMPNPFQYNDYNPAMNNMNNMNDMQQMYNQNMNNNQFFNNNNNYNPNNQNGFNANNNFNQPNNMNSNPNNNPNNQNVFSNNNYNQSDLYTPPIYQF